MSSYSIDIYPPARYCGEHDHDCWEVSLCLHGTGHYEINDKKYPYKPGFILCTPPYLKHRQYSDETFTNICILTSSFILDRNMDDRFYCFQDDSSKTIETLMMISHHIYQKKENNNKLITDSLYRAIEHMLFNWNQHSPENAEIEILINKLISSYNDPELSLGSLISESIYCSDHLCRIFKSATGMSPHSYLTNLRLNYAQRLLAGNKSLIYSIGEIGLMSGFYDTRYFSRIFKKKTGKTPTDYMRDNIAG